MLNVYLYVFLRQVLRNIVNVLPTQPSVRRVVLDFKSALWPAINSVLPEAEIMGCAFHWTQAVLELVKSAAEI